MTEDVNLRGGNGCRTVNQNLHAQQNHIGQECYHLDVKSNQQDEKKDHETRELALKAKIKNTNL